jgi:hypothetical protein
MHMYSWLQCATSQNVIAICEILPYENFGDRVMKRSSIKLRYINSRVPHASFFSSTYPIPCFEHAQFGDAQLFGITKTALINIFLLDLVQVAVLCCGGATRDRKVARKTCACF